MPGSKKLTASGSVGTSGKPTILFGFTMSSGDGGDGVVTLYDGTSDSGTEKCEFSGMASNNSQVTFQDSGKFFPNGLYAKLDANVTYADFDYEVVGN